MDFGFELFRLAGSFVLVVALLLLCVYGLKRWGRLIKKPAAQGMLDVVARHSFGPKHHLVLLKVQEQQLVLIGMSPQGMHFLTSVPELPEPSPGAASSAPEPA
jgi:flagellar biogenesis protein FliO